MDMLKQLSLAGLVPVIKVKNAEDAVPLCRALKNGGLPVAEITFRTDAAEEAIRLVHEALPEVLLGAGTVLTCEQADRAWNAGAGYIVAPGLNPVVVKHCTEKGYPVLPGCANPSDIELALSLGLTTVKFFPSEALGGLKMIKAMSAPYGNVRFVPTGGITEKNLPEYLAFPKIAACGGSWMVPEDAIAAKDWDKIEKLAREAVQVMLGFEVKHIGINNADQETAVNEGKKLAAICAAPQVFGTCGILDGKKATIYPSMEECLKGGQATGENVTVDGNIITGMGPALAMEFALKLVEEIKGKEAAEEVAAGLLFDRR